MKYEHLLIQVLFKNESKIEDFIENSIRFETTLYFSPIKTITLVHSQIVLGVVMQMSVNFRARWRSPLVFGVLVFIFVVGISSCSFSKPMPIESKNELKDK